MCICICTYTHVNMYPYIYVNIYFHIDLYISYISIYIYVHVYIYTYIYICIYIYIHIYAYIHKHIYSYVHLYTTYTHNFSGKYSWILRGKILSGLLRIFLIREKFSGLLRKFTASPSPPPLLICQHFFSPLPRPHFPPPAKRLLRHRKLVCEWSGVWVCCGGYRE